MLTIQRTGRNKQIAGRKHDGEVELVHNLLCARKHVIDKKEWSSIRSVKNFFAFVSSPQIYNQSKMRSLCKAWCHPFRKPNKRLPSKTPRLLLPESNFMDPMFVVSDPEHRLKYDYFYFTVNALPGLENKGLETFFRILPILAKRKLKGHVIVYYPNAPMVKHFVVPLSREAKNNLRDYKRTIKFHWGLLNPEQINKVMKSCRFGLFPNTVDNSPRLISESLIRDVPILMNESIHGGWHYVNDNTGALFNVDNIDEKLEFMMTNNFDSRSWFMANHGFRRSSAKLATFLSEVFD